MMSSSGSQASVGNYAGGCRSLRRVKCAFNRSSTPSPPFLPHIMGCAASLPIEAHSPVNTRYLPTADEIQPCAGANGCDHTTPTVPSPGSETHQRSDSDFDGAPRPLATYSPLLIFEEEHRDDDSGDAAHAPDDADDDDTVSGASSDGAPMPEPDEAAQRALVRALVARAHRRHGINGDPEQFVNPTRTPALPRGSLTSMRCTSWIDDVSQTTWSCSATGAPLLLLSPLASPATTRSMSLTTPLGAGGLPLGAVGVAFDTSGPTRRSVPAPIAGSQGGEQPPHLAPLSAFSLYKLQGTLSSPLPCVI
jgi:hypothetical protein